MQFVSRRGVSKSRRRSEAARDTPAAMPITGSPEASTGQLKRKFRLKAPIKPQLLHILEDYPGGQLLSEALQNAEDGGASEFALVLDQRTVHGISPELGGPAFVLIDIGSGFGHKEWESLQNLHQSEKRDSPSSIGAYGMGSRSYFHYSDVTLVVSCGEYVGLDPLEVISSHERQGEQGWKISIASPDGQVEQQIAREAQSLFTLELAVVALM